MKQSREGSSALPYIFAAVTIKNGTFGLPLTTFGQLTLFKHNGTSEKFIFKMIVWWEKRDSNFNINEKEQKFYRKY